MSLSCSRMQHILRKLSCVVRLWISSEHLRAQRLSIHRSCQGNHDFGQHLAWRKWETSLHTRQLLHIRQLPRSTIGNGTKIRYHRHSEVKLMESTWSMCSWTSVMAPLQCYLVWLYQDVRYLQPQHKNRVFATPTYNRKSWTICFRRLLSAVPTQSNPSVNTKVSLISIHHLPTDDTCFSNLELSGAFRLTEENQELLK